MITPQQKQEIFEAARARMLDWYGSELATKGACLYWNQVAMRELTDRGYRALLQAGTMFWRVKHAEADDNAWGYEWSPDEPFSRDLLSRGLLPEVHIWAALPDENCIVDFSTKYLPELAKLNHGVTWETEPPPEYIFGIPPRHARYFPNEQAIRFVWSFMCKIMTGEGEVVCQH